MGFEILGLDGTLSAHIMCSDDYNNYIKMMVMGLNLEVQDNFKPGPSGCFRRQGTLFHFACLHPGV